MIAKGPERASEENNYDRHNSMREGLLFPLYTDEKKPLEVMKTHPRLHLFIYKVALARILSQI